MRNIPYWLNIGSILYQYSCATREGKRDGRGREKKEEGWRKGRESPPPPFQIPGSATVCGHCVFTAALMR